MQRLQSANDSLCTVMIEPDPGVYIVILPLLSNFILGTVRHSIVILVKFLGSHTGTRILDCYNQVIADYGLNGKVSYIITDNASNMKAAFRVQFPQRDVANTVDDDNQPDEPEDEEEDEEGHVALWEENTDLSVNEIVAGRISCFTHSLQLVVNDGLKDTKDINLAMSKATRLSTILHRSGTFKVCSFKSCKKVSIHITLTLNVMQVL